MLQDELFLRVSRGFSALMKPFLWMECMRNHEDGYWVTEKSNTDDHGQAFIYIYFSPSHFILNIFKL